MGKASKSPFYVRFLIYIYLVGFKMISNNMNQHLAAWKLNINSHLC